MTVNDIYLFLCEKAPLSFAMPYDNPGFLLGNKNDEVKKVLVCLDATMSAVKKAEEIGASLIVTHHPVIFEPLKKITADENGKIFQIIKSGISVISMHTNLDVVKGGVNDALGNTLELENLRSITDDDGFSFRMGELKTILSGDELAKFTAEKLKTPVRYCTQNKKIKSVAVCGGSGGGLWRLAKENGADALVTADVKHSALIEAADSGFTLIDAGHFNTEDTVIKPLKDELSARFKDVEFIDYHITDIKTANL